MLLKNMGCYKLPTLKSFVLEITIRYTSKQSKVKHIIKQIRISISHPVLNLPSAVFTRTMNEENFVCLEIVYVKDNVANMFTKSLCIAKFKHCLNLIRLLRCWASHDGTIGESDLVGDCKTFGVLPIFARLFVSTFRIVYFQHGRQAAVLSELVRELQKEVILSKLIVEVPMFPLPWIRWIMLTMGFGVGLDLKIYCIKVEY